MNIPCILIPALVGLICGILGYLLGKLTSKGDDSLALSLQADLDACKANTRSLNAKISSLEADLAAKANFSASGTATQSFAANVPPALLFDGILAKTIYGKSIKENDLKIVEGIGPKIEALFNAAGITTWRELSATPTERLQAILDGGGENYAIHNPSTWAKQALLAYEGKWQELKDWQQNLLGGKE
jgi:predicted flap endonuclease-1-like 5' DNA nuclease